MAEKLTLAGQIIKAAKMGYGVEFGPEEIYPPGHMKPPFFVHVKYKPPPVWNYKKLIDERELEQTQLPPDELLAWEIEKGIGWLERARKKAAGLPENLG